MIWCTITNYSREQSTRVSLRHATQAEGRSVCALDSACIHSQQNLRCAFGANPLSLSPLLLPLSSPHSFYLAHTLSAFAFSVFDPLQCQQTTFSLCRCPALTSIFLSSFLSYLSPSHPLSLCVCLSLKHQQLNHFSIHLSLLLSLPSFSPLSSSRPFSPLFSICALCIWLAAKPTNQACYHHNVCWTRPNTGRGCPNRGGHRDMWVFQVHSITIEAYVSDESVLVVFIMKIPSLVRDMESHN